MQAGELRREHYDLNGSASSPNRLKPDHEECAFAERANSSRLAGEERDQQVVEVLNVEMPPPSHAKSSARNQAVNPRQ